jgi:hypothetical protein
MKTKYHKIIHKNRELTLELNIFEKNDLEIFKNTFNLWIKLNSIITGKLKGTRNVNIPDALTESIYCYEMNCGKLISVQGNDKNYSTSFDCYDYINEKRIQVKASSSTGPTSFGPRSEYDELYFIDFNSKGIIDGSYKIYKISNDDIDNCKANKKETVKDQQNLQRRPRFDIRSKLIKPNNIKPIKIGNL